MGSSRSRSRSVGSSKTQRLGACRFQHANTRLALAACAAVAAGCGGGAIGKQPSWRSSTSPTLGADTSREGGAPRQFIELSDRRDTGGAYNRVEQPSAVASPLSDAIATLIREGSRETGTPAPQIDGRMNRALSELAEVTPLDSPIAYPLLEFAMQRNGILEPSPHLVIIQGAINEPDAMVRQLRGSMASLLASGHYQRFGVGAAHRGGVDLVLLALQESYLDTRPIPRELPRGGSTAIEGTLARGYSEPHVFHTDEAGEVHTLSVAGIGASGFRALFSCSAHLGRQQVEITASGAAGSTVLANFPVWCGTRAPTSMRVDSVPRDLPPKTRQEAEQRMVARVNRDRISQGVPALVLDPRLTAVARRYSDEMLRTGNVAHVSPTSGSAGDRVKAGGVHTAVVLENVARAYGVQEAGDGLMNSPGHRANLLSRDVNRLGIGIALGREVAGRRELLVTQLFILVPTAVDIGVVRDQVASKIQEIKPMTSSPELLGVAQSLAQELARGVSSHEASARASQTLDQVGQAFSRVTTLITTVASVGSFDPTGSLGGPEFKFNGIGIAQGDHPLMGEHAIYIVVLLGEKRR